MLASRIDPCNLPLNHRISAKSIGCLSTRRCVGAHFSAWLRGLSWVRSSGRAAPQRGARDGAQSPLLLVLLRVPTRRRKAAIGWRRLVFRAQFLITKRLRNGQQRRLATASGAVCAPPLGQRTACNHQS